jgi:hypothetical protein
MVGIWASWEILLMLQFFWGLAIGISIGYPMGLWAIWYTHKEVKKHVGK